MFAGTLTVRPSESVNSTVAAEAEADADSEADADADVDADADAEALDAALELDDDPHPASPRTAARQNAKHHAAIAFPDVDNTFPWFISASYSCSVLGNSLFCFVIIHDNS